MIQCIGIGGIYVSTKRDDILVTHSLGSCIGVAAYDAKAGVGGMIHYQLAQKKELYSSTLSDCAFGDHAIPQLFFDMYQQGAHKENIRIVMAGGMQKKEECMFEIGHKNIVIARKLFWKNGVLIAAEDVGGSAPRTLYLDMSNGQTWFESYGSRRLL